eukprot:GILI01003709.1.p1 GENE.GILI01003709.1~~GILI01003709.1.p1  ORF type:complete len:820 (-),score=168.41 GILI01003709.1:794-3253(-)
MRLPLPAMLMSVVAVGCIAVALVAFLPMYFMSNTTTNEMGEDLIELSTKGSIKDLKSTVDQCKLTVDLMDLVLDHSAVTLDVRKLQQSFMSLLNMLYPTGINYLIFATERGYFYGVERQPSGRWLYRVRNETYACRTEFYLPNGFDSKNVTMIATGSLSCSYDPRLRSWYIKLNNRTTDISAAYAYTTAAALAMTFGRNLLYPNGTIMGVITTDVSAASLSDMLSATQFGRTGSAFVVEVQTLTALATSTDTNLLSNYQSSAGGATGTVTPITSLNTDYAQTALSVARDLIISGGVVNKRVKKSGHWVSVRDLMETPSMHWRLVIVVPVSDYFSKVHRSRDMTVGITVAMVMFVILLAVIMQPLILIPLGLLRDQVARVASLDMEKGNVNKRSVISEIDHLQDRVDQLSNAMISFTRYIPKEVVRDMLAAGRGVAELGMEPMHLCVLFSDIVKFTAICESVTPEDLSSLLNAYFSRCVSVLVRHNATVDKFIGDAIMAFWGAPIPNENAEVWACLASVHMQAEIERSVQPEFARLGQVVKARIGINSGTALVGNIGSADRISYTALGDTVNVAARLEGCNKLFGSSIMISSATREFISDRNFLVRFLGKIKVIGREAPLPIYEVHGVLSDTLEGGMPLPGGFVSDGYSEGQPSFAALSLSKQLSSQQQTSMSRRPSNTGTSKTIYSANVVAAARKRKGAFSTVEEALAEVKRCQLTLSKLERSAIRCYNDAMTIYQQGPQRLPEALKGFNACKEILTNILASTSSGALNRSKCGFSDDEELAGGAQDEVQSVISVLVLNHMISQCSQGEWSETLEQSEK